MTFRFKNKTNFIKIKPDDGKKGIGKAQFNFNFSSGELNRGKTKDTQYQIKNNKESVLYISE